MNKIILITIISVFAIGSCGVPQKDFDKLKADLVQTRSELAECSNELTEIKNTPEQRFIRAKKLFADTDLIGAQREYQGIVDNYEGTNDAKIALKKVIKIKQILKRKKLEAERKKALGFRILKPSTNVKYGDLSLRFDKIWTGKRWSFDDYGSEYRLRDAQRGNKHILVRVSISSKINNPSLPAILAYQMNNGELKLLGTLGYEFRRWKDYGSYLGNYADYGNDFAHSKTIPFNLGLELSNKYLVNSAIFIVLKKNGCFNRRTKEYGDPEIEYSQGNCNVKRTLKVEDFNNDYVLLKIFNKSKL